MTKYKNLTERILMDVFRIGTGRLNKIKTNNQYKKHAVSAIDLQALKTFIESMETEPAGYESMENDPAGYLCNHRRQKM